MKLESRHEIRNLVAFALSRRASTSLVKFVRLSASISAAPTGRIFVKFDTEEIY